MGGDSMCPGQPLGTSLFTLASGPGPKITLFEAREFLHAFLDPPEPVRPAQPGPALVHGFAAGRLGDLRRIARTVPQGRPDTRRAGGLAFPPRPGRVRAGVAAPGAALGRPHPPHHPATATLADRPEPRRAGPALPADDRHAPVGLGPAQRQGPRIPFFWGIELPPLVAPDKALAHTLMELHETGATIGYVLVGLHTAAALVHHYLVRDNTLARMLPWQRSPKH